VLFVLDATPADTPFPDPALAEREPDGLLALGGDLSVVRLLNAYRAGVFPWYGPGQPLLWWSPNPRTVLFPEHLRISRSLRKSLRNGGFQATVDCVFRAVVGACGTPRKGADGTWITLEMLQAYERLAAAGHAHSVEIWREGELVGGLYGVSLGRVFFGESMFSRCRDASKVALVHLVDRLLQSGFRLIDCQVRSAHLLSLGAEEIPRARFNRLLDRWTAQPASPHTWEGRAPLPLRMPPLFESRPG